MAENINWYPGHMKKTRELIAENLRLVGAVIEVCDARIPVSSRNPVLDELIGGKPRVLVLNKSDLADGAATDAWLASYSSSRGAVSRAIAMNSLSGDGVKRLLAALGNIANGRRGRAAQTGADTGHAAARSAAPAKSLRVMIVGVPNSGKSSLINRLTGRKSAQTGDRPGVTKGKQWLNLENGMMLLDTPGILWPKFEDPKVGLNLAFCGSIRDEIMDVPDLALELVCVLENLYPGVLAARYELGKEGHKGDGSFVSLMDAIARRRGCILPGGRVDYERAGRMLIGEFRAGKLGRVTLEKIHEQG